jgi:hypothetical protein
MTLIRGFGAVARASPTFRRRFREMQIALGPARANAARALQRVSERVQADTACDDAVFYVPLGSAVVMSANRDLMGSAHAKVSIDAIQIARLAIVPAQRAVGTPGSCGVPPHAAWRKAVRIGSIRTYGASRLAHSSREPWNPFGMLPS